MEIGYIIIMILLLLFALFVGVCIYYNHALTCEYYNIINQKIPKEFQGCKIVLLSDLHENKFGKNNKKLLDMIDAQHPDYIMIAGDMLVKGKCIKADNTLFLLKKLSQRYPIFYAPGNHEEQLERVCAGEEYKDFLEQLENMGVNYLANKSIYLKKGTGKIKVSGLHLPRKYYAKFYEKVTLTVSDLTEFLGRSGKEYEIVLAHNPNYFDTYVQWGADLVLSGHVHGGSVILPFLGGVISTTYELFPKYDFGNFKRGKADLVLSRGLGMHTIKVRLFNRPEVSVITLGEKSTCTK